DSHHPGAGELGLWLDGHPDRAVRRGHPGRNDDRDHHWHDDRWHDRHDHHRYDDRWHNRHHDRYDDGVNHWHDDWFDDRDNHRHDHGYNYRDHYGHHHWYDDRHRERVSPRGLLPAVVRHHQWTAGSGHYQHGHRAGDDQQYQLH